MKSFDIVDTIIYKFSDLYIFPNENIQNMLQQHAVISNSFTCVLLRKISYILSPKHAKIYLRYAVDCCLTVVALVLVLSFVLKLLSAAKVLQWNRSFTPGPIRNVPSILIVWCLLVTCYPRHAVLFARWDIKLGYKACEHVNVNPPVSVISLMCIIEGWNICWHQLL